MCIWCNLAKDSYRYSADGRAVFGKHFRRPQRPSANVRPQAEKLDTLSKAAAQAAETLAAIDSEATQVRAPEAVAAGILWRYFCTVQAAVCACAREREWRNATQAAKQLQQLDAASVARDYEEQVTTYDSYFILYTVYRETTRSR